MVETISWRNLRRATCCVQAAEETELDAERARAVIDSDRRYLIEGGQPVEVFESALREVAATTVAA